ncbi:MAG: type II toxin-antitoxin system RelE/ParE family toxin [Chloroflexota bacterium]|nr:type II toxin-antitoxin system RelE/ParE family toxin [Chloroflexota bacterium]
MSHEVLWHPAARRELKRLPRRDQRRVATRVTGLADDPRPPGCERLAGLDNAWRIRIGSYRVLYQVRAGATLVLVVRVAKRGAAYAHLETLRQRLNRPDP